MHTIAVFNLVNSSNCGDKLIAEAMESRLGERYGVKSHDILANGPSGTAAYVFRRLLSSLLFPRLLPALRRRIVRVFFSVKCLLHPSFYSAAVRDCDLVVIGGGQFFRDNDGYMASALDRLLSAIERHGKVFCVIGCGASGSWGAYSRSVFRRLFESPLNVFSAFRDSASLAVLKENGIRREGECFPDAAFALGYQERHASGSFFGVCVASPQTVSYYGKEKAFRSVREAETFMTGRILGKISTKDRILLFCNGNPEDYRFARKLRGIIGRKFPGKTVRLAERPMSTRDLREIVSGCGSVLSYRMHAAILASLFRIPCELERWDSKTEGLALDEESVRCQIDAARDFFARVLPERLRDAQA